MDYSVMDIPFTLGAYQAAGENAVVRTAFGSQLHVVVSEHYKKKVVFLVYKSDGVLYTAYRADDGLPEGKKAHIHVPTHRDAFMVLWTDGTTSVLYDTQSSAEHHKAFAMLQKDRGLTGVVIQVKVPLNTTTHTYTTVHTFPHTGGIVSSLPGAKRTCLAGN